MAGDETQDLWREYTKTKDQGTRDRLILTYAPLVKYVAGRLAAASRPMSTRTTSSRTACSA